MSLTDKETEEEKDIVYYQTFGSIRYLAFVIQDGSRLALSYSLLPTFKYEPSEKLNSITIIFPSHTIKLKGYNLELLAEDLENEKVKLIRVVESRYAKIDDKKPQVVLIEISQT